MAKYLTAPQTAAELSLSHLEVIRRIRRGDIQAKKLGWNWIIPSEELDRVRELDWYKRAMARRSPAPEA